MKRTLTCLLTCGTLALVNLLAIASLTCSAIATRPGMGNLRYRLARRKNFDPTKNGKCGRECRKVTDGIENSIPKPVRFIVRFPQKNTPISFLQMKTIVSNDYVSNKGVDVVTLPHLRVHIMEPSPESTPEDLESVRQYLINHGINVEDDDTVYLTSAGDYKIASTSTAANLSNRENPTGNYGSHVKSQEKQTNGNKKKPKVGNGKKAKKHNKVKRSVDENRSEAPKDENRGEAPRDENIGEAPRDENRGEAPRDENRGEAPRDENRGEAPKDENRGEAPRDENRGEAPRDENRGEAPRDENIGEAPKDENIGEAPKDENIGEAPKDENIGEAPKDENDPNKTKDTAAANNGGDNNQEEPPNRGNKTEATNDSDTEERPEIKKEKEVFTYAKQQWYISTMQISIAMEKLRTLKTSPIKVCIIDTGVDYNNKSLLHAFVPGNEQPEGNGEEANEPEYGIDAIEETYDPMDQHGHGTAIAGLIAGRMTDGYGITGVNPDARIIACKAFDTELKGRLSNVLKCINYCIDRGADVQNHSWTLPGSSLTLLNVFKILERKGVLVTVSAGNMLPGGPKEPDIRLEHVVPATYTSFFSNMVTVAGFQRVSEEVMADRISKCKSRRARSDTCVSSSLEPYEMYSNTQYGIHICQLVAPAKDLYTLGLNNTMVMVEGASFATGIMSGIGSLMLSAVFHNLMVAPTVLPQFFRHSIMKLKDAQGKVRWGGYVNALLALNNISAYIDHHHRKLRKRRALLNQKRM
ncbi:Thermophilic serine proteinase [Babesia sp. Xinjiang]|uniref:Thermophilic serine proteinase n=1 Tax=Babesia sp. Xinjiang TaxID=462227 RepID=UPI000A2572A4|nr:Thermophilic serine proteinase [Babesia sp. Xinjiang]ORM41758.1 Thermophilic serine proteinase [Babesia sp. Xinjiang]